MSNELVLLRRIEELEKLIMRQPEIGGVWKNWTPTFPATTTVYITGTNVQIARYCIVGKICFVQLQFDGTLTGGSDFKFSVGGFPFVIGVIDYPIMTNAHSTSWGNKGSIYYNSNFYIRTHDYSYLPLGAGYYFRISCFGPIA